MRIVVKLYILYTNPAFKVIWMFHQYHHKHYFGPFCHAKVIYPLLLEWLLDISFCPIYSTYGLLSDLLHKCWAEYKIIHLLLGSQ